jgi:glycosyltransferase involved in cell wall biosynthesis
VPREVVMIGAFPPPLGGAAKNNQLLFESLSASGVAVTKLDTAASSLSHRRSLAFHRQRIWRNARALLRARALGSRDATLYLVPNAGLGAWYSLAQMRASSSRFGRIVIHHRSFRYIDRPSRPMSLLTRIRPEVATHVFLSDGMARAFQDRYGPVRHLIASNARFVASEVAAAVLPRTAGPLRIGHLSNLCREKGFFEVAESFETIRNEGIDAELHLAGPIIEPEVEARIAELTRRHGAAVVHAGPLNGAAKLAFYRRLDVFFFPTQFAQEASPNVVYEALAAGIPVVATRRGCIAEIVGDGMGAVSGPGASFAAVALDYVRVTPWDDDGRAERSARIKSALAGECQRSLAQYAALMDLLGADPGARIAQEF